MMKRLDRAEIPEDFFYYRSHSGTYFSWVLHNAGKKGVEQVKENGFYGYVEHFFRKTFSVAWFEKCDFVPDRETLQKYGFRRGLVFWSGWRKKSPEGRGWRKLPFLVSRKYHHSTRSAFSILEPEYWKKWLPGLRGHRTAIRRGIESGEIRINTEASLEVFLDAYQKTKIPHKWKRYLSYRQKFLSAQNPRNFRIYLASVNGETLAGAIFLDDAPTSTYLMAFQDPKAKPRHLGLALVDHWFAESLSRGFKYLDLDHMRGPFDPASYAGYTKFKSGIADYDLRFDNVWVKGFW